MRSGSRGSTDHSAVPLTIEAELVSVIQEAPGEASLREPGTITDAEADASRAGAGGLRAPGHRGRGSRSRLR